MPKILVIDDEKSIRNSLKEVLEYEKHTVDMAMEGMEGIELFSNNKYDVVLCDIKMPKMDGLETPRRIRHPDSQVLDRNVPIIAVTANAMQTDRQQCLDCGMNDYLTKPIDAANMLGTISAWLPAKRYGAKTPSNSRIPRPHPNGSCPMDMDKASQYVMGDDAFLRSLLD